MIYFDNSATTKISDKALEEMTDTYKNFWGNPSSIHTVGQGAKEILELNRYLVASIFNVSPEKIIFTSGGTESDNFALVGTALKHNKGHIISTQMEHPAILNTLKLLENLGYDITLIAPDKDGIVSPREIEKNLRDDTFLISVMHVNNEVGTIQPIEEIGELSQKNNIIFHTDAVQGLPWMEYNLSKMSVDLVTFSSHKIHGPKGIGLLYIKDREKIRRIINGGAQELELRSGTESVPLVVGFSCALRENIESLEKRRDYVSNLKFQLEDKIVNEIEGVSVHGENVKRVPGISNFSIKGVKSRDLQMLLSLRDICVSGGSACSAGSVEPSHVITSMGLSVEEAESSIRVSLSHLNTTDEIEIFTATLKELVEKLRRD